MIKVHIADHHKMLVDGIYSLIDRSEIAIVSGISETLADCRRALQKQQPDVLLTELSHLVIGDPDFPLNKKKDTKGGYYNGIDFCEDVKHYYPHVKIVVLTGYSNWTIVRRMLDIGVSGYVLKTSPLYEAVNAVDSVMDGNIYLCEKSRLQLRKEIREHFFWVTVGEQKFLRQLAEGFTNEEIADRLCLAHSTIITKRKLLIQKFGGEGSINMLRKAMQMGLIWEDLIP
ncbi:MAG: response regulator transcription factor [Tannerella sp.]|jgi:DNA-binding NarL/FixJ family response regulator|nr:response regulator transcription factor [Tannerella sp.]